MNQYEPYASLALTKLLYENGFDWPCSAYRNEAEFDDYVALASDDFTRSDLAEDELFCPTIYHAAKWLRDVKGLFVDVWLCAAGYSWSIEKCSTPENRGTWVTKFDEESGDDENSGMWTTYEKALEDGIIHALNVNQAAKI